jgi:hypothetical protein
MRNALEATICGVAIPPSIPDRQYFKTHRTRRYRMRLASKEEASAYALTGEKIESNFVLCVAVQRVTMNRRIRAYLPLPAAIIDRMNDERLARMVFERIASNSDLTPKQMGVAICDSELGKFGMLKLKIADE